MVPISSIMRVFDQGLAPHFLGFQKFSENSFSFDIQFVLFIFGIQQHFPQNLSALIQVFFQYLHGIGSVFSACVGVQVASDVFNAELEHHTRPFLRAFEVQMLEKMSASRGVG